MKVYTKTGDDGSTSLVGGGRVSKSHPLIEACGKLDELSSFVALLSAHCPVEALPDSILRSLLCIEACVASQGMRPFEADTALLEERIDTMTAQLPPLRGFILPTGCRAAALAHVCRTVCRTAERRVCAAAEKWPRVAVCLPYLNRLSDYFFVLARHLNFVASVEEKTWENTCESNKL